MSFTVRLSNNFGKIADGLRPKAAAVVSKIAHTIEADAKSRAAVDTGAMRASISVVMDGDLSATIAPTVDYAVFVEYGTSRGAPAQPFMTPAAEAARQPFEAAMAKILEAG